MGFFDFLSTDGRAQGRLKKHVSRARNKDAQSVDRMVSLEALAEDGSQEAIAGLLFRFTIRYDKNIDDEHEKQFVYDHLMAMGPKILPPLRDHLDRAQVISWGLKLLQNTADKEQALPILSELCAKNDNQYTRDPSKKTQLINHLGEHEDVRVVPLLIPYLSDIDEGVRYATVESLLARKSEDGSRDALIAVVLNAKEESRRIKRRIIDGLAELGWDVSAQAAAIEAVLPALDASFKVDNGRIKKR